MTARDIAHCRLINQRIVSAKFTRPAEIVSLLGAMQAQDYLGALWAIGPRSPNSTETVIEKAIADRTIIRTWPMRGTLHFVAPADVRLDARAAHTVGHGRQQKTATTAGAR